MQLGVYATLGATPLGSILRMRLPGSESGIHVPFFDTQIACVTVGLQVGGIDHHSLLFTVFGSQTGHHPGEDALFVAALEPVAFATHLHRFQRL